MIDKELRMAILELNPKVEFIPNKDEYIIGYDIAKEKVLYRLTKEGIYMEHDLEFLKRLLNELMEERQQIAQYSVFGDNNWASMDEQIRILTYYIDTQEILSDYDDTYELVLDLINYLNGSDSSYIEFMDWEDM